MSDFNYGRHMAYKRSVSKKAKAPRVTQPGSQKTSEFKFKLDPMSKHDGSLTPRPIQWGANGDVSDELVRRVQEHFTILKAGTGLGKTALGLETVGKLQLERGKTIPVMIIAPAAVIAKKGWQKTVARWNEDNPNNQLKVVMIESPGRVRMMMNDPKARRQVARLLGPRGFVLVDEVHNFKTPTSAQTKALVKLRSHFMLGLSATPLTNDRISDSISYLVLAGFYGSKTGFIREHKLDRFVDMRTGKMNVYRADGQVLTEAWGPSYQTMTSQLAETIYSPDFDMSEIVLPSVTSRVIQLDSSDDLDSEFRSLSAAWGEGAFESATDLRQAQIETIQRDPKRLDKLMELVSDPQTAQPLIFYWNNCALEAIRERLDAEGLEYQIVSGKHKAGKADFSQPTPLLIQYQAGSEGIEMPGSNTSIFYQNGNSYSRLEQARGRNVRRGSEGRVRHFYLVADNIFDQTVFTQVSEMKELNEDFLNRLSVSVAEGKDF